MNNDVVIPNDSTYDVVTFDILSDGEPIDPTFQVMSINVDNEVNRIPKAYIIIRDGDVSEQDFAVSNVDAFVPGKEMEIKVGRDRDTITVFKGLVIKHGIKINEDGVSVLVVECQDTTVKMTVGRKNKYFEDSTDSDVIEEVLGEYEAAGEVEPTDLQHAEVVQHYATDWDFMLCRAEMNGKLVLVNEGLVDVKAPDTSTEPVVELSFGHTIFEFEAEMDARTQWKTVEAKSWDYASQDLFNAETSSAEFTEPGNVSGEELADVLGLEKFELRHSGQVLTEELQSWADACMLKSRLGKIVGRGKFQGFAEIKPGVMVKLSGVGERFNGNVYITGTRHEVKQGTWYTHAQFGLCEDWFYKKEDVIDAPSAGLLPAIHGLQIGKVVQLESDPDGEDRILVKLPIIDNDADGVWARVASLDAGENRGAFFRPELDDEVIVGFVNDDPRDPVVLGMLNSSAKPAPIVASDDNHEKGFVTRDELKVLFDDDKKIITISTPAGNSIVISEEDTAITLTDQNDNTITMDPDGIALKSPADINVEADGNINIKASGDLSMEGTNVTTKASAQYEAEGGAGVKVSSSAIVEVQGSLIKLN